MNSALASAIIVLNSVSDPAITISDDGVDVMLSPRAPAQMSAFYEARGFPKEMIDILSKQCFITVGVQNNREDVVWMNLKNWKFSNKDKEITRYHRDDWKQQWIKMNIPMNFQSTFRWTLIPEKLDYRPDEREGGNIILPATDGPITVDLDLHIPSRKNPIHIHYEALYCAQDPKP